MSRNTELILKSFLNYIIRNFEKSVKIIDLGCGRAYIVRELINAGFKNIYGLDAKDQREFKEFQFLDNIDLCNKDWSKQVIDSFGKFDLAIATEVIEHLTNPYLFLNETSKILNHNGILILTFPNVHNLKSKILYLLEDRFSKFFGRNFCSELHPIYDQHIFIPNIHLVKYLLRINGFNISEIKYINGFGKLFSETIMIVTYFHQDNHVGSI